MEPVVLIVPLVLGVPLVAGIWLIVRAISARNRIDELSHRVDDLQLQVIRLSSEKSSAAAPETKIVAPAPRPEKPPAEILLEKISPPPVAEQKFPAPQPAAVPPPLPSPSSRPARPEFIPPLPPSRPLAPPRPALPKINWEQFLGVKGLAWVSGLALFLFVAFAIQYSFQHNLIRPEIRMALGFVAGLGLLVGGVVLHRRKQYIVGAHTLCAIGVLVLYAVTFACRALYHFPFFGPVPTFLLMALITTTAFLLAARLDALVVAILGMLGGFLTPLLLSTGQDNPLGLFGYIAILDTGLIVVALNKRWHFLTTLAALGTVIMQLGWADKFFTSEKYFEGNKIFIALAVLLGFNALWLAANWWTKRSCDAPSPSPSATKASQPQYWLSGSMLFLAAVALAFTAFFFTFAPLAGRPALLFSFIFLIDLAVAALVRLDEKVSVARPIVGLAVFGLLALWTAEHLTNDLLNAALAFYFIFALFHSALPAWLQRSRGAATGLSAQLNHFFPPLALLLVLVPIFKLAELSFLVWPFVLLVDLLAIVLAVMTATLLPVIVVLLLTLAATGALIFKIPADLTGLPTSFYLIGGFAIFFVIASVWLARKFKPDVFKTGLKVHGDFNTPESMAALLPASSVVLPFLLLIMTVLRLPLADPTPVFGLALLLVVLLLGLTKIFSFEWMPLVGLISTFALECAWHFNRFDIANPNVPPTTPLAWYLIFFASFAPFPFLFLKKFSNKTFPWAAAALAGPAQFLLIFRLVKVAWPNATMGLLPAVFALPALASLVIVLKKIPAENKSRLAQLAWFGGVALFFITLIFPIQFDRQWITIGWALEGAALLWLFHRVPHPGLRLTGIGLLVAAFVRLAFNPAVLEYYQRSTTPVFNWYLYTYGIATVCLFLGTKLLAPPRHLVLKSNAQAILGALGTVLAFLLLNIEIADYFSAPGSTLTFQFSGNFARDMSYSIGWGLFALVLLVVGILKKIPAARYAALALLIVTLVKLFFHDLANLNQLYRIGALGGVAVIAMLASFAYQKFFSATAKEPESKDETKK
jgi:uncharacterized membrane protein